MGRSRVLLSEASSLTAREFTTVLGRSGVDVEAVSPSSTPIVRFSRWCRRIHRAPAPSADPLAFVRRVDELMATGDFDALLATHEQAWLFAAGRRFLTHARIAVADIDAFDRVQSKVTFARLLDSIDLPQPGWRQVDTEADLAALGFPVWVKAAFSTAGRGVARADTFKQAIAIWHEMAQESAGPPLVMVQAPAPGRYAQVQGIFDRGRLVAAAVSEQLAIGAGKSAAARISVVHPEAVAAIARLGAHISWHGGLTLDYLHVDGKPAFIECNPRTTEPGNAAAAGVNLPMLSIALARGDALPSVAVETRPGIRTRSTLACCLGAAEQQRSRRAVWRSAADALLQRPPLNGSIEVLTPILADPASVVPFVAGVGSILARPRSVADLAGRAIDTYAVTPSAVDQVRSR